MNASSKERAAIFLLVVVITCLGYWAQVSCFLCEDVTYLLHATDQWLSGEKYGIGIFETNPPMILALYSPAYLLAKWTACDILFSFRLYVIFLILLSVSMSFFLIKKIVHPSDRLVTYFLSVGWLVILLFLPNVEFGQREHFLSILTSPYLFLMACRLQNKKVHPLLAALIGLMLGLGVGMKPFFIMLPVLIESYFMLKRRDFFSWVRIESVVMGMVLLGYIASILLFQPGYFHIILPLVFKFYFPAKVEGWQAFLGLPSVIFCAGSMTAYFFCYRYDRYFAIGSILWLALAAMTVAFIIPRMPWYYHVLPAFSLAFLLVLYGFSQLLSTLILHASDRPSLYKGCILWLGGLIIVLFAPLHFFYECCQSLAIFKENEQSFKIAQYLNAQQGEHSVYCFQLSAIDCFPLVYDTHSQYASRFPGWWWYPGLRATELEHPSSAALIKDKAYLIRLVVDDLKQHSPRWVIIDQNRFQETEGNMSFQLVDYLSENPDFRRVWKRYHYVKSFNGEILYERY